jgi:hypothetical protein
VDRSDSELLAASGGYAGERAVTEGIIGADLLGQYQLGPSRG